MRCWCWLLLCLLGCYAAGAGEAADADSVGFEGTDDEAEALDALEEAGIKLAENGQFKHAQDKFRW